MNRIKKYQESKRHVIIRRRARILSGRRRSLCRTARRGAGTRRVRIATFSATARAPKKLDCFSDNPKLAAFLSRLLIIPLVQTQPTLDQYGTALAHVLADIFSGTAEDIHIDKRDLLLLLASLGCPRPVYCESNLGNGLAVGSITELRITRQIPYEDDFVEAGHNFWRLGRKAGPGYFASTAAGASVNSARNTSPFRANLPCNVAMADGALAKMMFT